MRRLGLTLVMVLMGAGLVAGSSAAIFGNTLLPLDQQVGTHTSAAGAVLGLGLIVSAFNPSRNTGWVRAGILYGLVVVAFEAAQYFIWHEAFHLGPAFFGLAFSLLLIALYPQRRQLVPPTTGVQPRPRPAEPAKPAPTMPSPQDKLKDDEPQKKSVDAEPEPKKS